jgi:hypothetical protein
MQHDAGLDFSLPQAFSFHLNRRLELTAEEKEEEIRRLQRELERILRKRKEEEYGKATRPCNHTVKKSVATQTGRETRQEDSPVEIVGRTAQMKADGEFRSAERRTEPSAKQSAILIDEGATPVVLQDMSPVEVTGTERNGPKLSGMIQQNTSPMEMTETQRNERTQSRTVLQEMSSIGVTGTKLKDLRQSEMVEARAKGLSERMDFESPSFLDLGRPALDSVRVDLFGSNRHIEDAGSRFRPQAQTERNGLQRNGQLRSARERRATRPQSGENRWSSSSQRNGESSGDELGGFTGFEMPQMPAALLARAATLEKAGRAERSPGGSQKGRTVDCPQKRGRSERPRAEGRPEKGSAQLQERIWPEHYLMGRVSREQRSPESDEQRSRERTSPEHLSREQQATERLFAEERLTERRPTEGQSPERWSGAYPNEGEGRQRRPERPVMLTEQRCRQHSLRLTAVTNGEDSPQSPANRLIAEHREWSGKHFRLDLQQGGCEKAGKRREGSLEEDKDGFFTPGTRAHRVWDPARDPLPSSPEQLMELRDTLQLRVQVRGLI